MLPAATASARDVVTTKDDHAPLSSEVKRLEGEVGTHAHHPLLHLPVFEQLKQRNVFRVAALNLGRLLAAPPARACGVSHARDANVAELRIRQERRSTGRLPVLLKATQRVLLHRPTRITTNAASDSIGKSEVP
jgi:hypothetical protein